MYSWMMFRFDIAVGDVNDMCAMHRAPSRIFNMLLCWAVTQLEWGGYVYMFRTHKINHWKGFCCVW